MAKMKILYKFLWLDVNNFLCVQILTDKDRLVKRTQMKRASYRVLGKPEESQLPVQEAEVVSLSLSLTHLHPHTTNVLFENKKAKENYIWPERAVPYNQTSIFWAFEQFNSISIQYIFTY